MPEAIPADGAVPDFFPCIQFDNDVMILITEFKEHPIGHYAFKVTNEHFDRKVENRKARLLGRPQDAKTFECYLQEGNKGFYIINPSGHGLEVLTKIDG